MRSAWRASSTAAPRGFPKANASKSRWRAHWCILFSSHVMQEVAALCDRVVIIGHGRVLADDTPLAIRERSGTQTLEEAFLQVLGDAEGVS